MMLSEFWFILIGVLFVGFFYLEGFDFGVGMSTQFLAKNEDERRVLIKTIGPVWDANEVWLITAGGAMFAAFPHWYATAFSGYYMAFVLLLLALIVRGVSFEFREKGSTQKWRYTWDLALFTGSILPPFLFGVFFTSLVQGLPMDEGYHVYANFFGDIVNFESVLGGVVFVLLSYLHGLFFIGLKTVDDIRERAFQQAKKVYVLTGIVSAIYLFMFVQSALPLMDNAAILYGMVAAYAVFYFIALPFLLKHREGWSFLMTGFMWIVLVSTYFVALFPNVVINSVEGIANLSLYDAASGDYSLKIMTYVALTMVPIVLGYTIWSYYVFRKRIVGGKEDGY
ncbi:MAG TPA: cytochrome d ubiquinol oxidase subunit II [Savagea sp.]